MSLVNRLRLKRRIDLDLSRRCPIQCPMCWRQTDIAAIKSGKDMTMEDFLKVADYCNEIFFAGALSDPIHHPKLIDFLKICYEKKILCEVQTASSYKSKEWFIEAFKANPNARWQFGIDGLPVESHKYRINQDGQKLFDMMLEAKKILKRRPIWQYIVFGYNEDHVEYCKQWAGELGLNFKLVLSGKATDFDFKNHKDYITTKEEYIMKRNDSETLLKSYESYMRAEE